MGESPSPGSAPSLPPPTTTTQPPSASTTPDPIDSSPPPPSSPPPSSPPPSSPPPASLSPPLNSPSSPPPALSSPPPNSPSPSPPPNSPSPSPPSDSSPPPAPSSDNDNDKSDSSPPPSPPNPSSSPPPSSSENNDKSPSSPPPSSGSSSNFFPPPSSVPRSSSSFSPPSSTKALAPPPPRSTPHKAPPSGNDGTPESAYIIGGVAGGAALLFILMIVLLCLCTKKKKKGSPVQMQYYSDPSHSNKGGDYYNNGPQYGTYYNNQYPGDHSVKIPPPPGSVAVHGGWVTSPPPPPSPPQMMSSISEEYSTSSYCGQVQQQQSLQQASLSGFNKSTFTYDELAIATGGFTQSNILGQGGFGFVHKGVLPNGKEVAVKSLKAGSGQGEREFQAEVDIISRVHHRHLVSLVGYCIAGDQRMLVYEFLPNKTLEYHLHGKDHAPMDWSSRLKIAMGSAKGLAYLHEDCHPRIIHRDIKTANILIDHNMEAKVADFGLAKLTSDTYTHVSTRIMGTFGYLAPEYASSGKLTEKSDVFSFGVMLLELITGKRPVDTTNSYMEDSLVDWARPIMARALEDGNFAQLVDENLENNYDVQEMTRMIASAAACIRHSARRRPKMSQIVRALEGDVSLEDLNEVAKPGQGSTSSGSNVSSEHEVASYNADMKKFRRMALQSEAYESSEYGGNTSEYGLNPSSSSSDSSQELGSKTYGSKRQ